MSGPAAHGIFVAVTCRISKIARRPAVPRPWHRRRRGRDGYDSGAGAHYHARVLIKGFAVVAGRKRLFLLGVFLVAVILSVLAERSRGNRWLLWFAVILTLILLMFALSVLTATRYHPAVLFVRPEIPAFVTAVNLAPVFSAAAFILLAGGLAIEAVGDVVDGEELWVLNVVTAGLWAFAVVLHLYLALGSFGVRLRPDGVHDRQPFGSLFVPWDAFAPGCPAAPVKNSQLTLHYRRPELVRRRGMRPAAHSLATGTDATYLAAAIHQYVACPEHRSAIGSDTELRRLTARLAG